MSDDSNFEVGGEWAAVELSAVDITNGTYTVTSRGSAQVFLARRTALPIANDPGVHVLVGVGNAAKYVLGAAEFLYARTSGQAALIGVIAA